MHYVDEGPKTAPIVLLLHGEPTWSYLYRFMIMDIQKAGFRVIAPDLIGFGKSDKLLSAEDYTYANHIRWMRLFIVNLDLFEISVFFQDWGSLIGLRVLVDEEDRFARAILSNGALPSGRQRVSKAFKYWRAFAKYSPWFPIGRIVKMGCARNLSSSAMDAYDAPFPQSKYKIGARKFPRLVPINPSDIESKNNYKAFKKLTSWKKPFLTLFGDRDPITRGAEKIFQKEIPGCKGQEHRIIKNAGHFIQEDQSEKLSELIIEFIRKN
jgi:haloalkane dehalogenase